MKPIKHFHVLSTKSGGNNTISTHNTVSSGLNKA